MLCIVILLLTYFSSILSEVLSIQTLEGEALIIIAVAGALPFFGPHTENSKSSVLNDSQNVASC